MCGIAGFFLQEILDSNYLESIAIKMARKLEHRGPDDEGVWIDGSHGIGLAHKRLSILDLSEAGHQPMVSACGRYVIVFNGEIYNHLEIRLELEREHAGVWRGHSDTETLLASIVAWGLYGSLNRFVGMFSIAIWDREEKTLCLARDRFGEKPLYYGFQGNSLLFGSELKALEAFPEFEGEVDRKVLELYLRQNVVPSPYSIYKDIFKLPPGTFLQISQNDILNKRLPTPSVYWSLADVAERGQKFSFKGTAFDAVTELDRLLNQSVSIEMQSDVPVGAFLSGGVDSSTVVALMQKNSTKPVNTFSIGFLEKKYNEAGHASAVAKHLGTSHTELYVTPKDALLAIPELSKVYDEPFADVSQIPTFLISNLARQNVKVCLTGDGGDELFGGYNRYVQGAKVWSKTAWIPRFVRSGVGEILKNISPATWDNFFDRFENYIPPHLRHGDPGDKIHKVAAMLATQSPNELYMSLVSDPRLGKSMVRGGLDFSSLYGNKRPLKNLNEIEHQLMLLDGIHYLSDDVLVKVDRAAMGVSLEARVPILDHRIAEFAWSLPLSMKIHGVEGKWVLRRVLEHYVPNSMISEAKRGFSVPVSSWLRGQLRDWAEGLLDDEKIKRQGFFDPGFIKEKWNEHLSGQYNWSRFLWAVLMFQAWLESRE